jgi:hypothetical protein
MASENLNNHHRDTLREIFDHQRGGNVEWRKIRSLLEAVGTVDEQHDGKLKVAVGPETEILHPPHGKDVDRQLLVDLRRMLTQAGLAPGGEGGTEDQRDRDYGDSRWGKPT